MIPRSRYAQIPSLPVLCFDIAVPVFLFFNVEPPELSEEGVHRTVCEGNELQPVRPRTTKYYAS